MQYNSHIPSFFPEREKGSHDFSRHNFTGNGNFIDKRGYTMFAHKSSVQQYLGYDKESMRQMMHYQDETFRCQVRELHRLYKRQRELMDDITMRQIFMRDLQSQRLKSQAQLKDEEKLSLTSITGVEERRLSHPAHLNNGDSGLGFFKSRDSSGCEKKSKFFIDLNKPLMPEPEPLSSSSTGSCCLMGIIQHNQRVKEEAKSESAIAKPHGRLDCDIDLNTMPSDFPSEPAVKYGNHDHSHSKENSYVDLNVNGENELEAPLSPNNRRSYLRIISEDITLEPRREGEPIQELDRIAAETLVSIFSSARTNMYLSSDVLTEDLKNSSNSLSWFANVISSLGDDQEDKVHDQSQLLSDRTEEDNGIKQSAAVKRKSRYLFRVVRNETQSGIRSHKPKRFDARDMKQDTQMIEGSETDSLRKNSNAEVRKLAKLSASYDVKTSTSSVLKQLGIRNKQCVLHDWGRIKKRQGGLRRRSKYQVMT